MLSMIFQNFSGSGKTKKGHSFDSRNPFDFRGMPPAGIGPAAHGLGIHCSIH